MTLMFLRFIIIVIKFSFLHFIDTHVTRDCIFTICSRNQLLDVATCGENRNSILVIEKKKMETVFFFFLCWHPHR